jgi:hypothetical protein
MQNIPLFGSLATKDQPPAGTVASGYFPLQLLPAEQLNFYLNGATQAIQEMINIITLAGLTPGTSEQLWTAISGLMSAKTLAFFAATSSAQLAGVISDETGSGSLAFATSPTFAGVPLAPTPAIGTNTTQLATSAFVTKYLPAQGNVQGLTLSNDSGTPNTVLDIASGAAVDTTYVDMLILGSAYTKTTGAWAVGTGNGGLDTGAVGAASWYSVWIIKRPDTGVTDILFSLSATAPTMPANYTLKRRIGWFKTASSNIVTFQQLGNRFF